MCQDGIRGKNVANSVNGKLLNDGIVHGGDGIKLLVLGSLEGDGSPGRNSVEDIVVAVKEAAPKKILLFRRGRRVGNVLGYLGQIELVDALPIGTDGNRCLPIDAVSPPAASEATAAASPSSAAAPTAATTATGTVPPRALRDALVRGRSGIGSLPLLPDVELPQPVHLLPLPRGRHEPPSLSLGGIDELEGLVFLGIDSVLELDVGTLPVPA
mmetsp:Transcript_20849/g.45468  ORF Transcript_20849/g.45468 Transcript_20849/m.45468 type:complete len:213 (+) Transcript_20849:1056-1694(+)